MSTATLARVRSDALPELLVGSKGYRDDGCDAAPSCLNCPFPSCRYDVQGGVAIFLREIRDREIRRAAAAMDGAETYDAKDVLARRFGVSRRTVYRVLAAAKEAPME